MSVEHTAFDVARDVLVAMPKDTIVKVTHLPSGESFELKAEGRALHDFVLHSGNPSVPALRGRRNSLGQIRTYWSVDRIAHWIENGLCTVEPSGKAVPQ